jgi:3-hydroxybutyryl-CoA dehydrogenase
MDLIGHDVNEAVTRQVWAALGQDPRFAPSPAQHALVEAGRLGRKAGRGVFDYTEGAPPVLAVPAAPARPPTRVILHPGAAPRPGDLDLLVSRAGIEVTVGDGFGAARVTGVLELPGGTVLARSEGTPAAELAGTLGAPVVVVDRTLDDRVATAVALATCDDCPEADLSAAVGWLQAAGLDVYVIDDTPGLVVTRTVAMLVNVAVDAAQRGVADAADLDTAMQLGTNYPLGPLAWGDRWGAATVHSILVALQASYGEPRYRPSPVLRRRALSGRSLSVAPAPTPTAARSGMVAG